MRDAIVYLRMPGSKAGQLSESFVEAIPPLLEADPTALGSLETTLRAYSGFLNKHDLEVLVAHHVVNPNASKRIASLIWEATKSLSEWDMAPKTYIASVLKSLKQNTERKYDAAQKKELENRLSLLIKNYPSVRRQWKAESLAKEVGVSLDEVRIVSDLRPVFTENREFVEGLFPITLCKLVWTDIDGMPKTTTINLSEDELNMLAKQFDLARTKLNVLKKLLKDNKLTMPLTQSLINEGAQE